MDINIYMTGSQTNIRSSTLNIATHLLYRKTQIDLITGLQSRTQMGRPNWDEIFAAIAAEHALEKADVFFSVARRVLAVRSTP